MSSLKERQDAVKLAFEEKLRTLSVDQIVQEYSEGPELEEDVAILINSAEMLGLDVPDAIQAKREILRGYREFIENSKVCLEKGHEWEVDGHFGPDTGCETACCKRCGESVSVTYY